MHTLRFRLAVAGLVVVGAIPVGCASGATQRTASESTVQGAPPEEEPSDRMPQGPEVKVDEGESKSTTSESADQVKSADQSVERERTYVPERRVETLLEHGPQYIFQVVAVEPVKEDGDFRGYRIADAGAGALEVMKPQLQIGDVVTEVNGVPIEKPDDYVTAWKKLKHRAVFEVEYRRDGESDRALWYVRERVEEKQSGDRSRDGGG